MKRIGLWVYLVLSATYEKIFFACPSCISFPYEVRQSNITLLLQQLSFYVKCVGLLASTASYRRYNICDA